MSTMKFTREEKDLLVAKIKAYFEAEMGQELGGFEAEFLLDFFAKEVGPFFYNRALYDAQAVISERVEALTESLYELEKSTAQR